MVCITPDGKLTESGRKILSVAKEFSTPDEISKTSDLPLFRVRSSLRELLELGFLEKVEDGFRITPEGKEKLV
ncbi:MAG: hypothetical protein ACXQTJ_06370 [Candidatus Syntropharchaeales archaeon]